MSSDWYHRGGMDGGDWTVMVVLMLVFLAVLVALVVWAVQALRLDRRDEQPRSDRAQALLAERFARGEIDADEFSRRRELLRDVRG